MQINTASFILVEEVVGIIKGWKNGIMLGQLFKKKYIGQCGQDRQ
jgi:hypothetical protein